MAVRRTQGRAARPVEFPVGSPEPSLCETVVSIPIESREEDLLATGIELSQDHEQIPVIAFGSADPELGPHPAG